MGILNFLKGFLEKENNEEEKAQSTNCSEELHIDEEDRIVLALAASAMAGKDKPNSCFHITRIRRIK